MNNDAVFLNMIIKKFHLYPTIGGIIKDDDLFINNDEQKSKIFIIDCNANIVDLEISKNTFNILDIKDVVKSKNYNPYLLIIHGLYNHKEFDSYETLNIYKYENLF